MKWDNLSLFYCGTWSNLRLTHYGTWSNSNLTRIGRLGWTLILMTVGIQTYFGLDLETKHKSAAQTMSYFRDNLYEAYKSPTKPVDHDQQSLTIQPKVFDQNYNTKWCVLKVHVYFSNFILELLFPLIGLLSVRILAGALDVLHRHLSSTSPRHLSNSLSLSIYSSSLFSKFTTIWKKCEFKHSQPRFKD